MIRIWLSLLLLWIPSASLPAQSVPLDFADGLWLFKKLPNGNYGPSEESLLMPLASADVNPDWLAAIVDGPAGQNVVLTELNRNGTFPKGPPKRVFAEQERTIALSATPRSIQEIVWNTDGDLLLVVAEDASGQEVWLLDPRDRNPSRLIADERHRSSFVLLSSQRFFFASGDAVYEWRKGEERRLFSPGFVRDLSYLPQSDGSLLYYRDEGSNAGIYLWALDGKREKMLVNLPSTSELSPRYNADLDRLAFVSNHEPGDVVDGSGERLDIRRRWHLYEAQLAEIGKMPVDSQDLTLVAAFDATVRMPTSLLLEDKDYQDIGVRNRNVFRWLGGSIYFLSQGESEEDLRSIRSVDPGGRLRAYRFDTPFERDVRNPAGEKVKIEGGAHAVRSFEVFRAGSSVCVALSAEARLTTQLLQGAVGGGTPRPWEAETFLLLYTVSRSP